MMYDTEEKLIFGTIGIITVAGIALIIWAAIHDGTKDRDMYNKCLQDHKDYECYSLIYKKNNDTVVVPIPIYTGK